MVVIPGEGTAVPAKEICFGVSLIIGAFNSAAEGYLADCEGQTGMVSGGENGATTANLVALYNLEFRLMVEENLQNTTTAMGMFAIPVLNGGYLEYARAVVADTITKMSSPPSSLNMASATATMLSGDGYYHAHNYKVAYKSYQRAYIQAVQ